jgi:hypothetical protein
VAHGDGRVDAESLSRFVAAYQTVTPLKLGELWAIPIMLRLAVIENLRRVGVLVAAGWIERELAGTWADRMAAAVEKDPKSLILVVADMVRSEPPMTGAFVAELMRRLQGAGRRLPCRSAGSNSAWPRWGRPRHTWCRPKTSSRPPIRSPSATASAACACWGQWTGGISSRR